MELVVILDESQSLPLYRQLHDGLRDAILSGRIGPGQKLPSTRNLSARLCISRTTVAQAYEQLEVEGFLSGRHGSGTYVSLMLPEGSRPTWFPDGSHEKSPSPLAAKFKQRLAGLSNRPSVEREPKGRRDLPYDFHPGQVAWDLFPREVWRRLLSRQWRASWREAMDYGDPAGYEPLREEVARYLARSRAVRCSAEQVVIVNGTQQALDLLARILLKQGDRVAAENPGYAAARQVFLSYGAQIVPIPVDQHGIAVEELRGSDARLVLVAPSHQFPTGATLSLSRRLSLLAWTRAEGGIVVEDDYDSEFRFEGRPLASLQGLDDNGGVVYLGSFSKVLFPSLRVGYAVLPADLVGPFVDAKELTDRQTPMLEQQVLADFMKDGHFDRHLRRMRDLYRGRRKALVEALSRHSADTVQVMGADAGMHLMACLPRGVDEADVVDRAARRGVAVYQAAPCYYGASPSPALVLGYAAMPEAMIRVGAAILAEVIRS
jgi:GntR family transcriptional regulator/MocR family aminotransferase